MPPFPYPAGLPIGDDWVPVPTEPIAFPYDGSEVAQAPVGDLALAGAALDAAVACRQVVGTLPAHVRRRVLLDVAGGVRAAEADLVDLLVLETGKPKVDCRVEVARTLVTLEAASEEVARIHGETVPLDLTPNGEGLLGFWIRRPIGVVVGIAGFNYPLLLATHKIAPAIAAGCPVICKPAPQTPLATLWLVHLLREALAAAGAPLAAVQLVTGGVDVGATLVSDRRVGAVSFTGSAAVGHRIARDAAPTKVLLELGSNAALVVAEDADLDAAAGAIVTGGYYASGQACISVQRVIVVESVHAELIKRVRASLDDVVVGDPRDETTRVSALVNEAATTRVRDWVARGVSAGAELVHGGEASGPLGPTVLDSVPDGTELWDEEIFGPVVCVRAVPDIDAAFAAVNSSRYGLHASVFTRSLAVALRAAHELEVGGVLVNVLPGFRADTMPYGGVKDSGIGREGPRFAVEELTVSRMVIIRAG